MSIDGKQLKVSVALKTCRFSSRDLEEALLRYVAVYNHRLLQSALKSQTWPIEAIRHW